MPRFKILVWIYIISMLLMSLMHIWDRISDDEPSLKRWVGDIPVRLHVLNNEKTGERIEILSFDGSDDFVDHLINRFSCQKHILTDKEKYILYKHIDRSSILSSYRSTVAFDFCDKMDLDILYQHVTVYVIRAKHNIFYFCIWDAFQNTDGVPPSAKEVYPVISKDKHKAIIDNITMYASTLVALFLIVTPTITFFINDVDRIKKVLFISLSIVLTSFVFTSSYFNIISIIVSCCLLIFINVCIVLILLFCRMLYKKINFFISRFSPP